MGCELQSGPASVQHRCFRMRPFSLVRTTTAGGSLRLLELGGPVLLSFYPSYLNESWIFTKDGTEEAFVRPSHLRDAADCTLKGIDW